MIVVRNIRVTCLARDVVAVSWEYGETTESLGDYTIAVLRSEGEAGDYADVSSEIDCSTAEDYDDEDVNLYAKSRDYHWRLRVTRTATSATRLYGSVPYEKVLAESADPGGVVLEAPQDLVAAEVSRRFELILREFTGGRVLVLPSRTSGTRCTNCWDALKRRKTISACQTCYGTGVVGGFYTAREAAFAKVPSHLAVQLTPLFEMQPSDVLFWASSRPRLKPRDVVVDTVGWRWRVLQVQRAEKGWALTRQVVQLRRITRDQVEYDVPVSWDRDSFTAMPQRNFVNATDIESYWDAVREKGAEPSGSDT